MFSLNELGQMNGTAGGGGGLAEDEEMPVQHELGEELAFTGRCVVQATWQTAERLKHKQTQEIWQSRQII